MDITLIPFVDLLQQDVTNHGGVVKVLEGVMDHDHPQDLMIIVESIYSTIEGGIVQYFGLDGSGLEERCVFFVAAVSPSEGHLAIYHLFDHRVDGADNTGGNILKLEMILHIATFSPHNHVKKIDQKMFFKPVISDDRINQ